MGWESGPGTWHSLRKDLWERMLIIGNDSHIFRNRDSWKLYELISHSVLSWPSGVSSGRICYSSQPCISVGAPLPPPSNPHHNLAVASDKACEAMQTYPCSVYWLHWPQLNLAGLFYPIYSYKINTLSLLILFVCFSNLSKVPSQTLSVDGAS